MLGASGRFGVCFYIQDACPLSSGVKCLNDLFWVNQSVDGHGREYPRSGKISKGTSHLESDLALW